MPINSNLDPNKDCLSQNDSIEPQVVVEETTEQPENKPVENNRQIRVCINDTTTPLLILYGPPSCGKTMTIVRLLKYLKREEVRVVFDRNFQDGSDKTSAIEDKFLNLLASDKAAKGTDTQEFSLIQLWKNGKKLCQILEAPGEHFFNKAINETNAGSAKYPPYLNEIMRNNSMNKVWVFFAPADEQGLNKQQRDWYVQRIKAFKAQKSTPRDKFLVVFNKVDLFGHLFANGKVKTKEAKKEVERLYPRLFETFKNTNPVTSYWIPYNCEFAPFSTGEFEQEVNGEQQYCDSSDEHPKLLWNTIKKLLSNW